MDGDAERVWLVIGQEQDREGVVTGLFDLPAALSQHDPGHRLRGLCRVMRVDEVR